MKRIFLFVSLIACTITSISQNNAADMEQVRKLVMAHSAIANLYVDKVNEPKLVEAGIKAMLKELDPHSTYLTAKEVEKMNEPLQGNFEGIGVQFNMADDTLFVIQTVSKGPSEKVGILPGDRIVTVNDTAIAGVKMERDEIMKRLRGPKGSVVQLGIVRRGIDEQLVFRVTRDKIPVHTLDAAYMIAPKVGYVKISSFGATTHEEFSTALAKLDKEKMQHLILDLQGNGGGYLKAAVDIASDFLQEGQQIVYTEGAKASRTEFKAEGWEISEYTHDLHGAGPVGVMTDYEAKFYAQGMKINRLMATKTPETKTTAAGPVPRLHNASLTDARGYEESVKANGGNE